MTRLTLASLKLFPFEWTQDGCHSLSSVIAGLDPAIHLLCKNALAKWMDPRVKPAGDTREWVSPAPIPAGTALAERCGPLRRGIRNAQTLRARKSHIKRIAARHPSSALICMNPCGSPSITCSS